MIALDDTSFSWFAGTFGVGLGSRLALSVLLDENRLKIFGTGMLRVLARDERSEGTRTFLALMMDRFGATALGEVWRSGLMDDGRYNGRKDDTASVRSDGNKRGNECLSLVTAHDTGNMCVSSVGLLLDKVFSSISDGSEV